MQQCLVPSVAQASHADMTQPRRSLPLCLAISSLSIAPRPALLTAKSPRKSNSQDMKGAVLVPAVKSLHPSPPTPSRNSTAAAVTPLSRYMPPLQLADAALSPSLPIPCSFAIFFLSLFVVCGRDAKLQPFWRPNLHVQHPPPHADPSHTPRDHRGSDGRERRQVRGLHGKDYQGQGGFAVLLYHSVVVQGSCECVARFARKFVRRCLADQFGGI